MRGINISFPYAYVKNIRTLTIYIFQTLEVEKVSKIGSKLISDTRIRWLSISMIYNDFYVIRE